MWTLLSEYMTYLVPDVSANCKIDFLCNNHINRLKSFYELCWVNIWLVLIVPDVSSQTGDGDQSNM